MGINLFLPKNLLELQRRALRICLAVKPHVLTFVQCTDWIIIETGVQAHRPLTSRLIMKHVLKHCTTKNKCCQPALLNPFFLIMSVSALLPLLFVYCIDYTQKQEMKDALGFLRGLGLERKSFCLSISLWWPYSCCNRDTQAVAKHLCEPLCVCVTVYTFCLPRT